MLLASIASWLIQSVNITGSRLSFTVTFGCAIALALLVWRLIRFTIIPIWRPNEPREYPYWVPGFGHLISFFQNSDRLLQNARTCLGSTREPFAITVAGSTIYVLTKASDVAEAYRNIKTLSFDIFVQTMLKAMGNSSFCIQEMYRPLPSDKKGFPNPHGKPLATLARDMHLHQLYPGEYLDKLSHDFDQYFDHFLQPDNLVRDCAYAELRDTGDMVVPAMTWCSDVFTRAGQGAYFGPKLAEIDPRMTWKFLEFDDFSYQILFQYPKILSSKMYKAKGAMVDGLVEYLETPQEERRGGAWFVKAMENEMRGLGLSTVDIALLMLTEYWGINTNTRKAAFWMLANILHDTKLHQTLVDEIQLAFTTAQPRTPDPHFLLLNCPHLNAAWDETIRLSAFSASVRHITEDTVIGGRLLRKGGRLMIPYRQLHFDASVFGPDVETFHAERFLKDKNLTNGSSWRPYGGGTTQCPGRFAAKQVVLSFLAMLLKRFHVSVDRPQPFPKAQLGTPVLGIMANQSELQIRLSPRVPLIH